MSRIGRGVQQQGFTSAGPTIGPHNPTVLGPVVTTLGVYLAAGLGTNQRRAQQRSATSFYLSALVVSMPPPVLVPILSSVAVLSSHARRHMQNRFPLQGWEHSASVTANTASAFSSSILDSFNRANESPLSGGGNWATYAAATDTLDLNANAVQMTAAATNGRMYWTPSTFADCEAYVTLPVATGSLTMHGVLARLQGVGSAATYDGYRVSIVRGSGAPGGSGTIDISRFDNGVATSLVSALLLSGVFPAGSKIGIRCLGSTIEAWTYTSGSWTKRLSVTDTTYANGFLGIEDDVTAETLDDFGGGAVSSGTMISLPQRLLGPRPPQILLPLPSEQQTTLVVASLTQAVVRRQQAQQRAAKSLLFPVPTLAQPPPFFGPQVCLLPVDRMGRRQRRHNLTWFLSPPVVVDPATTFIAAPLAVRRSLAATRPERTRSFLSPPTVLQTFAGVTAHTVSTRPRRTIRTLEPPVLVRVPQVEQQQQTIKVVPARIRPRPTEARIFAPSVLSVFPGPQTHLVRTRPKAATSRLSPPTTLRTFAAATSYLARVRPRATATLLSPPATLQEFFGPYEKQIAVTAAASPRRHSPISKLFPPSVVRVPSVEQREQTIVTALARIRPRHTIAKLAAPSVLQTFPAATVHLVQTRPRPTVQTLAPPTLVRVPAVEQQEQTVRAFTVRTRPRATGASLSPPTTLQTFEGPSVALSRSRPRPTSAFVSAPTVLQTFAGLDVTTVRTRPRPTLVALAPPTALSTFAAAKATLARTRPQPTTTDLSPPTVINASVAVETTIQVTLSGRTRVEQQRRASHWKLRQPVVVIPLPTLRMQTVQVALAHTRPRKTTNALSRPTVLQTFAGPTTHLVRSRPVATTHKFIAPYLFKQTSSIRVALVRTRPRGTTKLLSPPTVVDRQASAQIQVSLAHTRPRPTTHTLYPPTALSTFTGASVHQARILPRPTTALLRPPTRVLVPSVEQQEETIRVTLAHTRPRPTRATLRGPVDTPPVVATLASSLARIRPERTLAGLRTLPVTVPQRVVEETIRVALVQPVGFRRVRSRLAEPTVVARLSQQAQTIRVQLARTRPRPTVALVQPPIFPAPTLQQQTLRVALARIRPPRKRVLLSPPTVVAQQTFARTILVKLAVQARLLLPRPKFRLSKPAIIIVPAPGVTFGEDVAASAVEDYDIASSTASDEETVAGTAVGSTDSAAVESTLSDVAGTSVEGEDKEAGT